MSLGLYFILRRYYHPGGPSSPFFPFFFAGSASRGRDCAGVPAGAGSFFGVSGFTRGSPGSVLGAGNVLSSRRGLVMVVVSGLAFFPFHLSPHRRPSGRARV